MICDDTLRCSNSSAGTPSGISWKQVAWWIASEELIGVKNGTAQQL
jgi:hypothetical protein